MTVRISPARARQLGLPGVDAGAAPSGGRRRTRRTVPARECAPTFCVTCDETFPRPVDEDRHFAAHHDHARYGCVLEQAS